MSPGSGSVVSPGSGTVVSAGPAGGAASTRITRSPVCTAAPPAGSVLITRPGSASPAGSCRTSASKPSSSRRAAASAAGRPDRSSSANGSEPSETTICTLHPGFTSDPAEGLWRITRPSSTRVLVSKETSTSSPTPSSLPSARSWVNPRTSGISIGSGPADTTISTAELRAALAPAGGDWSITRPSPTVSLRTEPTTTVNPWPSRTAMALSRVDPITVGTCIWAGPPDTTMVTNESAAALSPSAGSVRMTRPGSASLASVTGVTRNPASWSTRRASSWVSPTASGTVAAGAAVVEVGDGSVERLLSST